MAHLILAALSTRSKPVQVCRDNVSSHNLCSDGKALLHIHRNEQVVDAIETNCHVSIWKHSTHCFMTHYVCAALYHFQMAATCIILLGYQSHPSPAL